MRCPDADTREALWCPPADAGGDGAPAADPVSGRLRLCFPEGWPTAFTSCAPLKAMLGPSGLRGARCRAVGPPSHAELAAAAAAGAAPAPLRSFENASRLAAASVGHLVVKGFVVYERRRGATAGEVDGGEACRGAADARRVFVAVRHWWNAAPGGRWVDLTPPLVHIYTYISIYLAIYMIYIHTCTHAHVTIYI